MIPDFSGDRRHDEKTTKQPPMASLDGLLFSRDNRHLPTGHSIGDKALSMGHALRARRDGGAAD